MYSTILTIQLQPGTTEEAVYILQDKIAPALNHQPGFKAAHLVGNRDTDKVVYLTFWETEADIALMDSSGIVRQSMGQFAHLFAAPPTREIYEVLSDIPGV